MSNGASEALHLRFRYRFFAHVEATRVNPSLIPAIPRLDCGDSPITDFRRSESRIHNPLRSARATW